MECPMKRFRFQRPVLNVQGHQIFTIEAKDKADAIKRCGDADYEYEELEVTSLGNPENVEELKEGEQP